MGMGPHIIYGGDVVVVVSGVIGFEQLWIAPYS